MSESYSRRSWKGIACAVLVITAVAAIISVIVVYATPVKYVKIKGTLDIEDVINGKYSAKLFNGTWCSDTQFSFMNQNHILLYDVTKLPSPTQVFVPNSTFENIELDQYFISNDLKYVLLSYNISKVYRHSSKARYKIFHSNSSETEDLINGELLQYVGWGPKDSQLVYVRDNNLWYISSLTATPVQVTKDGEDEVIYNGIPDWVYEEEVLTTNNAIWWSPDGSKLAFMQFNDSSVDYMNYMHYGDPSMVYPELVKFKYPKSGETNPTVKLFIVDLDNPTKLNELEPPSEIKGEHYITAISWATNTTLSAVWVPRIQNHSIVTLCPSDKLKCVKVSEEQSQGWVDSGTPPYFTNDGKSYFLIQPLDDNYRHLAIYSSQDGTRKFLTNGRFEVTEILFYDADTETIYFQRSEPDDPSKRQISRVKIDASLKEECLTCDIEIKCSYFTARFSKEGGYVTIICNGDDSTDTLPSVQIRNLPKFSQVVVLEENEPLKEKLSKQVLCDYKRISVPVANGFDALVRLYVPKDLNHESKYPLIVNVYGGPGSQAITNKFSVNYGTYLSSVKKYIYAEIDGRGSSLRGNKLMFEVYKKLGTAEIEDQIAVASYLGKELNFIDPSNMAIWGWSYGGFAAGTALIDGNSTFKCGISVAPVTSWIYYDSIYTERYMLEPKDNQMAYNASDLIRRASSFKSKKYMLIHGTGDDNVHVQQSMMLMKALNAAGVLYDTHIYPDEAHSISKSKVHVYRTITKFFDECFA